MRSSSWLTALAVGVLLAVTAPPASAADEPFETVKGWNVERTVGDTSAHACLMTRVYEDKRDNNARNAVSFALDDSSAALAVAYQGWQWTNDQEVKAAFFLDRKPIKVKGPWLGNGRALRTELPMSVVPDLLAARTVTLRFPDGQAGFDIPDFASGYESLIRCNATTPKPPPAPAAAAQPAMPSQARMAVYAVGLTIQKILKDCDVATTGKQRAAVEARIAALQPEMASVDAALRAELDKRSAKTSVCPAESGQAEFIATLRDFTDLSTEVYAEKLSPSDSKPASAKP